VSRVPLAEQYKIDVDWSDEDGAFVALIPDLPYAGGHGDSESEALSEARASIETYLELAEKLEKPIPRPSTRAVHQEQQQRNTLQGARGITQVADPVVAKVAGIASQEVDGITGGSSGSQTQGVSVEVGQEEAAIDLTLTAEYGKSIPQLAEAVRRNVANRVESLVGLRVTEVNITVSNIFFPQQEAEQERQRQLEQERREQEAQEQQRVQ
jgi:uncharacterized alkaline shock family protein YloU/predicted RNase H-like HicB family nuclease